MRWTVLALRRLGSDVAPTLGVVVLVLATAFVAAVAPRVLARVADDAVRSEIAAAPAAARNIVMIQHAAIAAGPPADPLEVVHDAGGALRATFPAPVQRLVTAQESVVESARFRVQKQTTDPAFVRLRIQEGLDAHVAYVEGRAPTGSTETRDDVGPDHVSGVPVFEASVAQATAERFGIALGEEVQLIGDPGDPLSGRTREDVYAFARITGIYAVPDPASDWWLDDPLPIHPVIRALSSEVQLLDAALMLDTTAYGALADHAGRYGGPLRYTWRYFLDTGSVTSAAVPGLETAFRRLEVAYPSANVTPSSDTAMRTGMLDLLTGFSAAWAAAVSILAVTAVGPALVAVATLGLIAVLAARRRRSTMGLARARGASARQVLAPVAVEGLLVALPAAAVAVAAAVNLVPSGRTLPSAVLAAVVVAVAVAVLLATVVPIVRSSGAEQRPGDRAAGRGGSRRLVLEGLLVALAVGSAILLRGRGLGAVGAIPGAVGGFDPLIAAVPALVGLAAGIVALRLFPLPMRAVASVARRGRGLVGMLAARRATEGGGAAVLLVLLATATVGAFGAVSLDALDRGADVAAWNVVGASYRVEPPNGALPHGFDATSLPGVETTASEFRATIPVGLSGPVTMFVAVEAAAYREVLAGTPVEPAYPPGFAEPGTGPIPAIVSRLLVENPRGVDPGETFELTVEGYTLTYRADAVVDAFPGVPANRGFVIAAREWFLARAPKARIVPVVQFLRAPPDAAGAIRDAVAAQATSLVVTSQAEDAAARRAAPVTLAVRSLILVAALVTAAYAALGVAAALALAGLSRTAEVAHLRTLGLTGRQSTGLLVAEHGPTTIAAFIAGGLLGIALFAVLRPALGLETLVGAPVDVPIVLEPAVLLLILAVMIAVVAFGLVLGAVLQRRVAPTAAIRGGFE